MFIMIDGIDGSGKSTVLEAWKKQLSEEGNAIFDLKNYWQTQKKYPTLDEIRAYDFIFSCEPTYAPVGELIRKELIKRGSNYSPMAVAEAYSLDRLILYTKIIVPLLKEGKCVIQDRGISSSLTYQNAAGLSFEEICALPGNKLALEYRPDFLVLTQVKPETAMQRLAGRTDKKDNVIFEKINFQANLAKIYDSAGFNDIFLKHGAQISYLSAEEKIDIMEQEAKRLLTKILTH